MSEAIAFSTLQQFGGRPVRLGSEVLVSSSQIGADGVMATKVEAIDPDGFHTAFGTFKFQEFVLNPDKFEQNGQIFVRLEPGTWTWL